MDTIKLRIGPAQAVSVGFALLLAFGCCRAACASTRQEAEQFAEAHAKELALRKKAAQLADDYAREKQMRVVALPPSLIAPVSPIHNAPLPAQPATAAISAVGAWRFSMDTRLAAATYQEEEQTITSEATVFFPEVAATLTHNGAWGLEYTLQGSFGQSTTDTESWDVEHIRYQTNDFDFMRITADARLGKKLHSESPERMTSTPFIGYGMRYLDFERSNFNILNLITIRDAVTENFWIHHLGGGVNLDISLTERFQLTSTSSLAWVFFNQADNSVLGTVDGEGGVIASVSLGLRYALSDHWAFVLGGFADWQNLEGGSQGNVIWPDNKLNTYGGNAKIEFRF